MSSGRGGGKRKYGRNKRSPAMKRYTAELRHDRNKRLKMAKHAKQVAKKARR